MEKLIIDSMDNQRLDQFLLDKLDMSRSKIKKMIENEKILVNARPTKGSYKVKKDDVVTVLPFEEQISLKPEQMDLDIVYEDEDVIVVNKKNGVVVHPAPGNYEHTLVNGLLAHAKLSSINGEFRPGVVHRIDAYTTGLLVFAKNDEAHAF